MPVTPLPWENIAGAHGSRPAYYKCVMPLGFIMLLMQGVAHFIRDIYRLRGEEI
jgi:TRAP-type mannitol/chloroaromatic compound transport system permease small subunit